MKSVITEAEYAEQRRQIGRKIHLHDGVWWEQFSPVYAKPAFRFRPVVPGAARPARGRSLGGYSHHVPEPAMGNQTMDYLVLEGEPLRTFSLASLAQRKRNQIRNSLKRCEVKPIEDLERVLEEARDVCISHSRRLSDTARAYHVPYTFFIEQADTWRAQVRRDFAAQGRCWWGAFAEGRLIGYMVTLQIEGIVLLDKMKLHGDYLACRASDALYFTALEHLARTESCQRFINSAPQREGLDRFKEQFLFKRTPLPFYVSNLRLRRLAKRWVSLRDRLRARFIARPTPPPAATGDAPAEGTSGEDGARTVT